MVLKQIDLDNIRAAAEGRSFAHPADTLLLVEEVVRLRAENNRLRKLCGLSAWAPISERKKQAVGHGEKEGGSDGD